jgi:hypothetical protein
MQWLASAGIFVALSILALAVATLWLALETRRVRIGADEALRLRRDMVDVHDKGGADALQIAGQYAAAGVAAADTAREIAVAARLAAEAGQRAWLSIDAVNIMTRNGRNFPLNVSTLMRNGGRTPALDVEATQFYVIDKSLPEQLIYQDSGTPREGNSGPGSCSKLAITLEYPPGAEAATRIHEGQVSIFLYGVARYRDILGTARETRWAFRYEPDLCQFRPCDRHNTIT